MQVGWEMVVMENAQMEVRRKDVGMEKKWDVAHIR